MSLSGDGAPLRALALALVVACTAPRAPGGRLVDLAPTLSRDQRGRIERYLEFVRDRYDLDYRVVLDPDSPGSPASEAERWYRQLDVGSARSGRGLLLWLDPQRRRARVEVGYALEGVVPDLAAKWILEQYLAPHVAADELPASLEAAIEGLVDRIRPRLDAAAEAPSLLGSGGAGATTDLETPPQPSPTRGADEPDLLPQADPAATRRRELDALRSGRYDAAAPIYDDAWRRSSAHRTWPAARLHEIAARYDRPFEVEVEGDHAVAFYRDTRELGPTLLRRQARGWVIDATAGARLVVYDYSNASWYLVDEPSPYVDLLRRVYDLQRVRLQSGRTAWRIRP